MRSFTTDQSMLKKEKEKDADGLIMVENEDEIEKVLEAENNLKKMEKNVIICFFFRFF